MFRTDGGVAASNGLGSNLEAASDRVQIDKWPVGSGSAEILNVKCAR